MLAPKDVESLGELIEARMKVEVELLDELRDEMDEFKRSIRQIKRRPANTISIVGTDGGNNNFRFDPFIMHVIRVVDSNNVEYYMDVITPTTPIEELENKIQSRNDVLKRMMDYLGITKLTDLSPMIQRREPGEPIKSSWIQVYRELVEWATLFSLVRDHDYASNTLIIFDGLLRSKVFAKDLFLKLREGIDNAIREQHARNNCWIYIVGVAKHSKVLERYNLVMHIDGVMKTKFSCYGKVPRDMEQKAYIWSEYARDDTAPGEKGGEVNKFVAGKMFLVKFGNSPHDPIWPVDILMSQEKESDVILGYLLNDASEGFPIPWYPMCLQKAHENSAMVGFDMDIIQGQMLDSIRNSIGDDVERFNAFMLTNDDLSARRYGRGL